MIQEKDLEVGKKYYLDQGMVNIGEFKGLINEIVTFRPVVNVDYVTTNGNIELTRSDFSEYEEYKQIVRKNIFQRILSKFRK